MTQSLTDEQFALLLNDTRCPVGISIGGGGVPIITSELVRLARLMFGDRPNLETDINAHVDRVGGNRVTPTSLDGLARRGVRRVLGQPTPPAQDIYEIPEAAFGETGRAH